MQKGLIILLGSILLLAGLVIGIYKIVVKPPDVANPPVKGGTTSTTGKPTNKVTVINDDGEEEEIEYDVPGSHKPGYFNILIVGTDGDGTRTDTIMIARMDTTDHTVALMSVPRDTLISANYDVPKINSVYGMNGKGEKGIAALRKQLTAILGFDVDGYVMVDLKAFTETVDLIGGVSFDVPQRMYYNDPTQNLHIDLQKGQQTLNGTQAMGLVRYRSYAAADIQRTHVQQDFMKAMAKQCLTLGNITKIKPLIEIFIEYVDTDLTLGNMVYFAQELLKCNFDTMESYTLPGGNAGLRGGSYYALFPSQVLEIVNDSFNPYDTDIPLGNLHIRTAGSGYSGGSSSTGNTSKPSKPATPATPVTPTTPDSTQITNPDDTSTTPPDTSTTPPAGGAVTEPTQPIQPNTGSNGADILDPSGDTASPGDSGGTTTPDSGATTPPDASSTTPPAQTPQTGQPAA